MRSVNIVYEKPEDLEKIRDDLKVYSPENILIQVFCGLSDMDAANGLRLSLIRIFPGTAIIGASSAGEIVNGQAREEAVIISVTAFKHTKVRSVLIRQDDDLAAAGKDSGRAFRDSELKAVIAFGCGTKDGNFTHNLPFIETLNNELGEVVIAGGQAGGYQGPESRVFVFTEQGLVEHGFAVAGLSGSRLCINTGCNLGLAPIGKKMTLTRARAGRIYSIDHKSVGEIYKRYLGIDVDPDALELISNFPFIIDKGEMLITCPISGIREDGSFDAMQPVHTGEQVRFSFCDPGLQEESAELLRKTLSEYNPEAVFVYSCASRRSIFGEDIVVDMDALASCPNSAGFFTFSEYYTDSKYRAYFLQQTMTVLSLSEARTCTAGKDGIILNKPDKPKADLRRFRLLKVMSHLVASTTRELEEINQTLAELADKDGLTGLFNRRLFDDTLDARLREHSRADSPLSLILLDVDFFKPFNDIYGHVAGDDCLRGVAQVIFRQMKRASDMAFRYGGEEFGCILPFTDHNGAFQVAENIRSGVEALSIPHKGSAVNEFVTVSLGVLTLDRGRKIHSQEIINACDGLLYQAKNGGRNRTVGENRAEH